MAGSRSPVLRSWAVVGILAVAAALRGCAPDSDPDLPLPGGAVRGELLASVGPDVVLPAIDAFVEAAERLQDAVGTWRITEAAVERSVAQDAWVDAMRAWQVVEVLQFGPTGSALSVAGGRDFRDAIYSWPTSLACRVDQELVAHEFEAPEFVSTELPNVLGLDAVEYLLFDVDDTNDCGPLVEINGGDWQALDLATLDIRRAGYAATLTHDVVAQAHELLDAWLPEGGDFGAELAGAGDTSTVYASDQDALDDLYRGLFYLELVVKDRKLARPLGLRDCLDPTCPDDLEHRWADFGAAAISANVEGFRQLFGGGEGTGFDELMAAIDQTALADEIEAALDGVDAAVDALPAGLADTLTDDPDALQALHDAVKELTDLLKGDFATLLTLQIPTEAASDND